MEKKIQIEREATPAEAEAIAKANEILNTAGLELVGTRPNNRS